MTKGTEPFEPCNSCSCPHRMTVCVSFAVYDVIRSWAEERGRSMSEIVSLLVADELHRAYREESGAHDG